jgi:hypothetical protein
MKVKKGISLSHIYSYLLWFWCFNFILHLLFLFVCFWQVVS